MFEAAYHSVWHNPVAFWVVTAVFLAASLRQGRRAGWLHAFVLVFGVEILADAWVQGELAPLKGSALATPLSIAFVILGDFRYFVLLARHRAKASRWGRALAAAALAALVVPVGSSLVQLAWPHAFVEVRHVFLVYEVMFLGLALGIQTLYLPRARSGGSPDVHRWLTRVTWFEIAQYGLWVTADVVILTVGDVGFLLRLAPNAMYYALFLPFVWGTAPAALRGAQGPRTAA